MLADGDMLRATWTCQGHPVTDPESRAWGVQDCHHDMVHLSEAETRSVREIGGALIVLRQRPAPTPRPAVSRAHRVGEEGSPDAQAHRYLRRLAARARRTRQVGQVRVRLCTAKAVAQSVRTRRGQLQGSAALPVRVRPWDCGRGGRPGRIQRCLKCGFQGFSAYLQPLRNGADGLAPGPAGADRGGGCDG
jgi:hypothetical protein